MNVFQLVIKQMRQRALGTWLTLLSVLLGVALATSIFLMRSAGSSLFGQTDFGYDVLVGVGKGSPLQLVLNTVYHIDVSPGNVPYWKYDILNTPDRPPRGSREFNYNAHVRTAVPTAVGDTYKGRPIIGTLPKMFVSLAGLRDRIDKLRDRQHELLLAVRNAGSDASKLAPDAVKSQTAVGSDLTNLRQEVRELAQQTTPLVEPVDPLAEPKPEDQKWRYGRPVGLRLDGALADNNAATAALQAGKPADAVAHLQAIADALDVVFKSAGADSGPLEYRPSQSLEIAQGRLFHGWKFEAVLGSEVSEKTGLTLGSIFQATHGNPGPKDIPDIHAEKWKVVGVLKKTHTAADRCLYIPLISFYCIAEHEKGLSAQENIREGQSGNTAGGDDEGPPPYKLAFGDELDPDLPHEQEYISLDTPKKDWAVSAIAIKSRGGVTADNLMYFIKNGGLPDVQAVNPAFVMREFFDTFFASSTIILLVIALLVSIVAAIGILVSIYNSVAARNREIAILRALGAMCRRVLMLICVEAGLIGLAGGVVGLFVGHLLGGVASRYMAETIGQGFNWLRVGVWELVYLLGVVAIALAAGFVPAMKAYRTPVATNLVGS